MSSYVQTVLGRLPIEQMGFTLPHEHLFWDIRFYLDASVDPQDASDPRNAPLAMELLGHVHYHMYEYADNLVQQDVETAARELQWFRESGGGTVCDCSVTGMGRFPEKVREASAKSGVNVLLGTGAYCGYTLPAWMDRMDADEMAGLFVEELRNGIRGTDVRCGFIGEIGINEGFPASDRRSLAAAAIAQRETGAALLIHQPGLEKRADEIFRIITDNGGNLDKTIMCHCDPLMDDPDYIDGMAKSGANISFDFFGLEIVMTLKGYRNLWLPTDRQRIAAVAEQIGRGNLNRLFLSHDTVYKSMLRSYGGFGYAHLQRDMLPLMLAEGYEAEWLRQMTEYNPQRVFAREEAGPADEERRRK